jgi:hypothetical protein
MKKRFEVAAGSIAGRDHLLVGKNNQDAYYSRSTEPATIVVVCDGCGSGRHSEVGAKLGARLVVEALSTALALAPQSAEALVADSFWEGIQQDILTSVQALAYSMGESLSQTIQDYFLFTIVGAACTQTSVSVFSIGDGVIIVNGKAMQLGPFPGNAPPYIAYGLLGAPKPQFQLHWHLPIDEVESILIGTDGVSDLIAASVHHLPGKPVPVGSIEQFWQQDRYFNNPDMIRRHLALINREATKPDWHNRQIVKEVGLLPDDTTLVVIRRRQGEK